MTEIKLEGKIDNKAKYDKISIWKFQGVQDYTTTFTVIFFVREIVCNQAHHQQFYNLIQSEWGLWTGEGKSQTATSNQWQWL